jgi:shikimate kinase
MEQIRKMRIFLIGYMGCGKSSFGKKLSYKLGIKFIDLDNYIENSVKLNTSEIFEANGEVYFRQLEHEALIKCLEEENFVMASGGGTPCFYNNIDLMNNNGITIYLKASNELLLNRLKKSRKERPLLKGKTEEEIKNFLVSHLIRRAEHYNKAHYIIDAKDANADQMVRILQHR